MSKLRKALAGAFVLALVLAGLVAAAAQGQDEENGDDGKQVVFDVGDPQGIDSMSPLIGVTVAAYEAWNIQYAMLTDKAAKDFSVIPGLAKSWEGSDDKLTWTYKLRPNMKWSDGKPLTAEDIAWTVNTSREEEWFNHFAVTQNLTAKALDDTTVEIKSSVPDPKLPVMDVYILPKHIWGKMSPADREEVRRQRRRGLRAVRARGVPEGPVRSLQGEPQLLGRQAGRRQGRAAQVQQPGRHGRRAQDGRARCR